MDTLTRLGRTERDEQTIPDVWLAVVEGRATPEALADLERRAESEPEIASLLAAFAPMSQAEEDVLVASLVAARKRAVEPRRRGRGPHRARRAIVAFAAVAAVLLVALAVAPSVRTPGLPRYTLEAATGDLEMRSATDAAAPARPRHHPSSALRIVLRPERSAGEPVDVKAYVSRNGSRVGGPLPLQITPHGTARLDGIAGELLGDRAGPMTLRFEIGTAGAAPSQVLEYELELLEP